MLLADCGAARTAYQNVTLFDCVSTSGEACHYSEEGAECTQPVRWKVSPSQRGCGRRDKW